MNGLHSRVARPTRTGENATCHPRRKLENLEAPQQAAERSPMFVLQESDIRGRAMASLVPIDDRGRCQRIRAFGTIAWLNLGSGQAVELRPGGGARGLFGQSYVSVSRVVSACPSLELGFGLRDSAGPTKYQAIASAIGSIPE